MRYCDTTIQMKVLDHIMIGENPYFSFADAGLIEEYNTDFLSLKEGTRTYARAESDSYTGSRVTDYLGGIAPGWQQA